MKKAIAAVAALVPRPAAAVHDHDWSDATRRNRWKMISGHADPFPADNDYSTLEVTDRRNQHPRNQERSVRRSRAPVDFPSGAADETSA